jgi:hypothetical protein
MRFEKLKTSGIYDKMLELKKAQDPQPRVFVPRHPCGAKGNPGYVRI